MTDQRLRCHVIDRNVWWVTRDGDIVGIIQYGGPGMAPFAVYQTPLANSEKRAFLGNVNTVLEGVELIKEMEVLR